MIGAVEEGDASTFKPLYLLAFTTIPPGYILNNYIKHQLLSGRMLHKNLIFFVADLKCACFWCTC